jgi:hypothetical protein
MDFELKDKNTPEISFLFLPYGWIFNNLKDLGVEDLLFLLAKSSDFFLE